MPGPRQDPHFLPTGELAQAAVHIHAQATAEMAAVRAWYWRPQWYEGLIPDTRKCWICGEEVFEPLVLTEAEMNLRDPSSPNVQAGPTFRWP